jgi:hypothetical protein
MHCVLDQLLHVDAYDDLAVEGRVKLPVSNNQSWEFDIYLQQTKLMTPRKKFTMTNSLAPKEST